MTKAQVLFVSSESPEFVKSTLSKLQEALTPQPPQLEVKHIQHIDQLPLEMSRAPNPHLVLLDQPQKEASVTSALRGLMESDPATCVLVLLDHVPTSAEMMSWMDRGATGLLYRSFKAAEVAEPLQEALSKRLQRQVARHPRAAVKHKIQMRLPSLEQALVAETLNVGTGGMFVRMIPPDIRAGDHIEFEFILTKEASAQLGVSAADANPLVAKMEAETKVLEKNISGAGIGGTGVVIWMRPRSEKNLPEGIGIQFLDLSAEAQKWLSQFVATHRIKSFVPQS